MIIVDANILLRYLLQDNQELFEAAQHIIERKQILIPNEIFAEVIYVLEKVYKVPRVDIKQALLELIKYPNLSLTNKNTIIIALEQFAQSRIDFVDALLIGYYKAEKFEIETFDKKLRNKLNN